MSKKIKVGIIGTGSISNEHISAYLKNDNVELYALCDIDREQLELMGKKYNIERLYNNKEEMLRLEELDAVSVCSWNSAHAECAIAALNAGKHVLCEKPMAVTVADAAAMKEAADRNNKLLMIGFVRRFGNDCEIVKDFISSDTLGEIYYGKATYLRRHGNPGGWFGDKSRSGGGPMMDLGVHVLDLTRYLVGNPKPVSVYGVSFQKLFDRKNIKHKKDYLSVSASQNDICDVEDFASALVRFDNGFVLSIETSYSLNIKNNVANIELFGTKGGAKLDPQLEMYVDMNGYLANINLAQNTALHFEGLFAKEINHFVSCIIDGIECRNPASDGVEVMEILNAIYESAQTGHEVVF